MQWAIWVTSKKEDKYWLDQWHNRNLAGNPRKIWDTYAQAETMAVRFRNAFSDYNYTVVRYHEGLLQPYPADLAGPIPTSIATVTPALPKAPVDLSDWKVWRDVNAAATDCPCGIARARCTYHG